MGVCIDKLPHSCGTKDGLQVFANEETHNVNGWCFACSTFVPNPYGKPKKVEDVDLPAPKSEEDTAAEMAEIYSYKTLDVSSRKLRASSLEKFDIRTSVSEEDGKTPTAMYFPMQVDGKTTGYYVKTLSLPHYTWSVGNVRKAEPFGWQQARKSGAYKLIITEGKEDAVAIDAIFERYGDEKYKPAVISLPNGTNSVKSSLSQIAEEASRIFREVVICFDNDKAGQKAVEDAINIFPQALNVTLPEKDANDCIMKGAGNAAYKALAFNAKPPKNSRLVLVDEAFHQSAREPTPYGELTWPFPTMNKMMRNLRYGETIYIGAGVKMGKSDLANEVAAHFIKNHNINVFMAKPEEENKKSYKLLAGKISGRSYVDPDVPFDYPSFDKAFQIIDKKLVLVNLYQHLGWESLRQDIIYAVNHYGVKAVFIDPITNLTNGMTASEANEKLQTIAEDLAAMAKDLQIVIFIFVHLKASDGYISKDVRQKKYDKEHYYHLGPCSHEFGGDVLSNQFAGSRAMMRSCNLMLALEGNKDPELPEDVRCLRWLTILEDREFGNSLSIPLYYNKATTHYREV